METTGLTLQEGSRLLALWALRLNGEYIPKCGIFITCRRSPVSGTSIAVVLKDIVQCPLFGVPTPRKPPFDGPKG